MTDTLDSIRPLRIADLDAQERPREKAMRLGVGALTDAELLAIVLGSGAEGMSVVDLARHMLASADNSINKLAAMSIDQLTKRFKGIGPAKAITLMSALQLGMRCKTEVYKEDPRIVSSADVYNLMCDSLRHIPHEEFWVLMLSQANRVKERRLISRGGLTATVVDIRVLMREVIAVGSPAIILVHNHPSGNPNPSVQDDTLTRRIKDAAATLDVRVLDHIIVAGSSFYSYLDQGRL